MSHSSDGSATNPDTLLSDSRVRHSPRMGENLRRFRAFGSAAERRDVGIHGGDLSGGSVTFVGITPRPARERFGQR